MPALRTYCLTVHFVNNKISGCARIHTNERGLDTTGTMETRHRNGVRPRTFGEKNLDDILRTGNKHYRLRVLKHYPYEPLSIKRFLATRLKTTH